MWWGVAVGTAGAGGLYIVHTAYMYDETRQNDPSLRGIFDRVRTIQDLVILLQNLARRRPTEAVVDEIRVRLVEYGITEDALVKLSRLHREYGDDLGVHGYAINMVWSTVVHALQDDAVLIVC